MDVHDKATRSRNMAAVRATNTMPEMLVRKLLHGAGFRFLLHDKRLPGRPDLVFPRYKAAIFVHGCFWHGHKCHLFTAPKTRSDFWASKIESNRTRDAVANKALRSTGWRVAEIWECSLKGKSRVGLASLLDATSDWLRGDESFLTVSGK